jgi:hypothetical protein
VDDAADEYTPGDETQAIELVRGLLRERNLEIDVLFKASLHEALVDFLLCVPRALAAVRAIRKGTNTPEDDQYLMRSLNYLIADFLTEWGLSTKASSS